MRSILFASALVILASCGGAKNKVIVMASGDVSAAENTITLEQGSSHNELEVFPTAASLTVKEGDNSRTVELPGNGLFLLNLKQDTLVGSYQRTGTEAGQQTITQEGLVQRIDSLKALAAGSNVSEANRNFNVAPGELVKISDNINAQVIGPFLTVPGSFEAGKEYEIYKFYTMKEMREIIAKLEKMATPVPAEEEE